jgi:aspartyl-tRNA(Asn)/glutamyl-tRNA(Gln) amidotransferase subunit A
MRDDLAWCSASEIRALYGGRELSPVDMTKSVLARVERFNPVLNAFVVIDADGALAQAHASEERWQRGTPLSPLDGQPVTIKDTTDLRGFPTRSGSQTTPTTAAPDDAPEAARLREAGCVILGKTTTPEFGWKGQTDSPLSGITRNPWKPAHTPGGSSGGAAAALACGIGTLAHGTDGGGSVRIPATSCGLFGLKPTFGRVPHDPHKSPFSTLVSSGPIARSVADAAAMLNELGRPDARDWYALPYTGEDYAGALNAGVKGLRLGLSLDFAGAKPMPEVAALVREAARRFEALGAIVEEVGPIVEPLQVTFEKYWLAGFASTLRGIPREKWDLLDPGFRALAERGLEVTAAELIAGDTARIALGRTMSLFHQRHDLLLTPMQPKTPVRVETPYHVQGNDRWADATAYSVAFNYTGQPAATIRCGVAGDGLPVGLQIVGPKYAEARILQAAAAYEQSEGAVWPPPQLARSLSTLA